MIELCVHTVLSGVWYHGVDINLLFNAQITLDFIEIVSFLNRPSSVYFVKKLIYLCCTGRDVFPSFVSNPLEFYRVKIQRYCNNVCVCVCA